MDRINGSKVVPNRRSRRFQSVQSTTHEELVDLVCEFISPLPPKYITTFVAGVKKLVLIIRRPLSELKPLFES